MPAASSGSTTTGGATASTVSGTTTTPDRFKGDEDDDDGPGEGSAKSDANSGDSDADFDNDIKDSQLSKGHYSDKDDGPVRAFGHSASGTNRQAITTVVERYYAAAGAGDGVRACALITPAFARAIPEDYGQAPGPVYLRGKTCSAVMTLLFKHERLHLAGAIEVTEVRVKGREALALLGSTSLPAGYLDLERVGGHWRIVGLLATVLP